MDECVIGVAGDMEGTLGSLSAQALTKASSIGPRLWRTT